MGKFTVCEKLHDYELYLYLVLTLPQTQLFKKEVIPPYFLKHVLFMYEYDYLCRLTNRQIPCQLEYYDQMFWHI